MAKRATPRQSEGERKLLLSVSELSAGDVRQLEASSKKWRQRLVPHRDAIVESERLTEADLDVRINTKTVS